MATVKTADYVTTRDIIIPSRSGQGDVTLIAGSFVKPVEYCYLPSHVKETPDCRHADNKLEVFCYSKYGFVKIPRNSLVQK